MAETIKRFVIAVYVENKYGVLTRVTSMFMRRGFNIDSLTVGETDDPAFPVLQLPCGQMKTLGIS